ncbi:MAG: cobaltochelatase CobT-related protein [Gemmataceae bacterium]
MIVEQHLRQLAGLAAGLCLDAGVRLRAGDKGWAWEPERRTIHVARRDLDSRGPTYCAGVLAHEVGHYHITRYHLFQVDFPSRPVLDMTLNGVEDPRVNTWIQTRYPGTVWWFDRLAEVDGRSAEPLPIPASVRFAIEAAREELVGWQALPAAAPVPAAVRQALALTAEARVEFARTLPPVELSPRHAPGELVKRYDAEVKPRLIDPSARWVSGWEQEVRLSQLQSLRIAEQRILPAVARLWHEDVERMGRYLSSDPNLRKRGREALNASDFARLGGLVNGAFREEPPAGHVGSNLRDLSRKVIEAWLRQVRAPDDGPLASRPLFDPVTMLQINGIPEAYTNAHLQVADQIERLVRELEEVLRPRRRLADRSGFASGRRLDLRRAMDFAADPRRHDRMWRRPTIPRRRDTAFLLLVDLSGSMRGEKTAAAVAGTVLLAESLDRLQVPFAVYGFQDVIIPFCEFGEGLNPLTRAALGGMGEEIAGTRPGGNNQPLYNDDGPCVCDAGNRLLEEPAREHVLIVVSDGVPEGRRSVPEDLHAAVKELGAVPGLRLVGIGLGAGTEHVKDFYPESRAGVPADRLAEEIGALLRQALLAGERATVGLRS